MKFKQLIIFILILNFFLNCTEVIHYEYLPKQHKHKSTIKKTIEENVLKTWYSKDIIDDSIPGISLDKAYQTILNNRKGNEVIVALIDKGVDIKHKSLKNNLWVNSKEIAGNNIDDDENGYIDDLNGWNFSGNIRGESNKYSHYDYVRIVKAYDSIFKEKEVKDIDLEDSLKFLSYKRAKYKLNNKLKSVSEEIDYANNVYKWKNEAKNSLLKSLNYSSDFKFTINILNSLKITHTKDSILLNNIHILSGFLANGYTDDFIEGLKLKTNNLLKKQLNLKYNERKIVKDNPNNINDITYGNPQIDSDINYFSHGTIMAGVIAENKSQIKIMPLCISGYGSKHDKDIALAIRYAVDNGAKVINMSFVKNFSLHQDWVNNAIKYAQKKNVVIIQAAGNDYHDMDNPYKFTFPDDRNSNGNEFTDNYLKIGGSTRYADESLNYDYSNYGKLNVDIFAPAAEIYTTFPNNEYKYDSGTSLASAITSKVAALLFSYYPNLSASQVKHIIMDSGVEYTFPVKMPTIEDQKRTIPFNELSKSGKIVNTYNALIMADSIAKKSN